MKDWYVWKVGCYVDPTIYYASQTFPKIDNNGYYRGHMMSPCMTVPRKLQAKDRNEAIRLYKQIFPNSDN